MSTWVPFMDPSDIIYAIPSGYTESEHIGLGLSFSPSVWPTGSISPTKGAQATCFSHENNPCYDSWSSNLTNTFTLSSGTVVEECSQIVSVGLSLPQDGSWSQWEADWTRDHVPGQERYALSLPERCMIEGQQSQADIPPYYPSPAMDKEPVCSDPTNDTHQPYVHETPDTSFAADVVPPSLESSINSPRYTSSTATIAYLTPQATPTSTIITPLTTRKQSCRNPSKSKKISSATNTSTCDRTKKSQYDLQCSLCPKRFQRNTNLISHLGTHNTQRNIIKCPRPGCKKTYGRMADLTRHIRSVSPSFLCEYI